MPNTIYKLTEQEALQFVLDAGWGLAKVSSEGVFLWVNPAYCEILGAPAELIIGTHWRDWTHVDDIAEDERMAKQTAEGDLPSYTFRKRYLQRGSTPKNPRIIWGKLSCTGIWKGEQFLYYLVQFQPFNNFQQVRRIQINVNEVLKWVSQNWKTIIAVAAISSSMISGSTGTLYERWKKAQQELEQDTGLEQESQSSALPP